MTSATSDKPTTRTGLPPRRWFGFLFFTALAIAAGWVWHRSWQSADLGMYHLRDGSVHGVLSHQGSLLLATTTLSLGPDKAFTADFTSGPAKKDGVWLFNGAYVNATWRLSIWHFGMSAGRKGDVPEAPELAWSAVVVPHGAVVVAAGLLAVMCLIRGIVRPKLRRRQRLGQCLHCGYDLRGANDDTCPECGQSRAVPVMTSRSLLAETGAEVRQTLRTGVCVFATIGLLVASGRLLRASAPSTADLGRPASKPALLPAGGFPPAYARVYDVGRARPPKTLRDREPWIWTSIFGRGGALHERWPTPTGPWANVLDSGYLRWRDWRTFRHVPMPAGPPPACYGASASFGQRALWIHAAQEQAAAAQLFSAFRRAADARP